MDCGERWAVFTAGMGVDGDVVAAVEAQRAKGRKVTAARYIRIAVREMLANARRGTPADAAICPAGNRCRACYFAFVSNSSPWTYANTTTGVDQPRHDVRDRPGRVRHHQHERVEQPACWCAGCWSKKPKIKAKHLIRDDDLPWVRITAAEPIACQIDGDFLGHARRNDVPCGSGGV